MPTYLSQVVKIVNNKGWCIYKVLETDDENEKFSKNPVKELGNGSYVICRGRHNPFSDERLKGRFLPLSVNGKAFYVGDFEIKDDRILVEYKSESISTEEFLKYLDYLVEA